jgi:hypothetical protein
MTKPAPNIYDLIHLNGPLDYHMGSELRFWRWKYSSGASVFSIFVRRRWAASFYDAQQALGLARSIDVLHLVNVHSSIRHWVWRL